MIISLRGTNGAGKSTIVRAVMARYGHKSPVTAPKRNRPIGYTLNRGDAFPELFVPGHYEIANGGVDTLHDLDWAYELIETFASKEFDVLYEGMNMSDGVHRIHRLGQKFEFDNVCAVSIQPPLEICVQSVRDRGHTIKYDTIERLHRKTQRDAATFMLEGKIQSSSFSSRTAALACVLNLLGLEVNHEGSSARNEQSAVAQS